MFAIRVPVRNRPPRAGRPPLRSGVVSVADAQLELHVEAHETQVEIKHGRVGLFGTREQTTLHGERATLEAIITGEESGIEAFLDGRLRVRGNIALALQLEGIFATRERPGRFPRPATVRVAGIDTFYLDAGEGPVVILLHGLGATNASMLTTLWDLARDHRVIAPDLPGFGESGKPVRSYSPAFFASWLQSFLDELDVERASIVGNSLGGRIALEAGLSMPDRVNRLVLLTPGVAFIRGRRYVPLVRLLRPEMALLPVVLTHWEVVQLARSLLAVPDRLRSEWYDSFADEFLRVWQSPRARIAFFSAARQVYLDEPDGDSGFWQRMRGLRNPALFIWGDRDWLIPAKFARHVGAALPNAESIVLPDCGHVPQYELPDKTNRLVRQFLDADTRPARRIIAKSA